MVIVHPMSHSDHRLNSTHIADEDGNVINSNSLESVTNLINDVRRLKPKLSNFPLQLYFY